MTASSTSNITENPIGFAVKIWCQKFIGFSVLSPLLQGNMLFSRYVLCLETGLSRSFQYFLLYYRAMSFSACMYFAWSFSRSTAGWTETMQCLPTWSFEPFWNTTHKKDKKLARLCKTPWLKWKKTVQHVMFCVKVCIAIVWFMQPPFSHWASILGLLYLATLDSFPAV